MTSMALEGNTGSDRFVIKFIGAFDIPQSGGSKSDPFLQAYISEHVVQFDQENRKYFKLQRISNIVQTPRRLDCTSVIWNCFRDFKINPPSESVLTVEMFDANDVTDDKLLGTLDIPVKVFGDEAPKIFNFVCPKSNNKQKNPNFSLTLSRVFINEAPPTHKTFFLIRHGESKWNLAQSMINITGMLDRDHALTEEGINQARELNTRWKDCFADIDAEHKNGHRKSDKVVTIQENGVVDSSAATEPVVAPAVETVDESTNYATGDLLGDFEDEMVYNRDDGTSMKIQDWVMESTNELLHPTPILSAAENEKKDAEESLGNEKDTSHFEQQLLTNSTPQKSLELSEIDTQIYMDDALISEGNTGSNENVTGGGDDEEHEIVRDTITSTWDEDPLRTTVAIINDFHKTNLDFQSSPKSTSLHLDLVPEEAPVMKIDQDEFFTQRRDEYINLFKHADRVYSSPLTRAIETAYVSMEGHPALINDGITLYSIIREIKRIGGLDTVGIEYGDAIKRRVRAELKAILGKVRTDELMSNAGSFSVNDADQPWWTAISSYENEMQQQERVREFISFVKHCDAKLPIFVGHSLFFKAFYSKRISSTLLKNRPDTSANLKKFRLSNASLLAVTVSFEDLDGNPDAIITDADLIFGGGFHGAHIIDEDECDDHYNNNNAYEAGSSPQQFFPSSIAENLKDRLRNSNLPHDLKSGKDALRKGVQLLSSKLNDFFEK